MKLEYLRALRCHVFTTCKWIFILKKFHEESASCLSKHSQEKLTISIGKTRYVVPKIGRVKRAGLDSFRSDKFWRSLTFTKESPPPNCYRDLTDHHRRPQDDHAMVSIFSSKCENVIDAVTWDSEPVSEAGYTQCVCFIPSLLLYPKCKTSNIWYIIDYI